MIKRLLLFFLIFASTTWFSIAEENPTISGNLGIWTVRWHGVGLPWNGLPGASSNLDHAISSAKAGNLAMFVSSFGYDSTNEIPNAIVKLFTAWQAASQNYVQLLVQEAVLQNSEKTNALAALSFADVGPIKSRAESLGMSQPTASVVFAKQVGNRWHLALTIIDPKICEYLSNSASRFVYRADSDSRESVRNSMLRGQDLMLRGMVERGEKPENILQAQEAFRFSNSVQGTNTWDEWKRVYKAEILNPPVVFDLTKIHNPDFSTPLSALQSYWHAVYAADAKTLLENSDDRARDWQIKAMGIKESSGRTSFATFTNLTRMTVLLRAENTAGGRSYVLFLSRKESPSFPKTNRVTFNVELFYKKDGKYIFTRDLWSSPFGYVLGAARATSGNLKLYPEFNRVLKSSMLPPHFYTIE